MANQRGETTSIGHFYNRCVDAVNNLFDTMSFWTHSKDVEFVDGKTAETKVGAINGITSDMSGEADDIAASIKCVNQLNNSLQSVFSNELLADGAGNFTVDISKYKIIMLVSHNASNGNQVGTGLYLKDLIKSGSALYSPVAGTTNFCNCGFNTLTSITMETNMTGIIPKLYGIK